MPPRRGTIGGAGTGGAGTGNTTTEVVTTGELGGANGSAVPGAAGSGPPGGTDGGAGAMLGDSGQTSTGGAGLAGAGGTAGSGGARADGGIADSAGELFQSLCQVAAALDRSCRDKADCVVVSHVSDCCGQRRLMGLRATEQVTFQRLEASCDAAYPSCDCAAGPPTTDDGSALAGDATGAGVACLKEICTTFARACDHPCAPGTTCQTCSRKRDDGKIEPYAVCSNPCTSAASCTDHDLRVCQAGPTGTMFCTAADVVCSRD